MNNVFKGICVSVCEESISIYLWVAGGEIVRGKRAVLVT